MNEELANLIHSLSEAEFFENHYGKTPFVSAQSRPQPVPTITREDLLAHMECLQLELAKNFRLARDGDWLDPRFYQAMKKEFGWVANLIKADWTLVVKSAQRFHLPLANLREALGHTLRTHVRINAYYTPPKATGFGWHWDPLDIFILQVSGSKRWQVLEQGSMDDSKILIDTVLEPGHMLFLPQHCQHNVKVGSDEPSIHLAVSYATRYSRAKEFLQRRLDDWSKLPAAGLSRLARPDAVPEDRRSLTNEEVLQSLDAFRDELVASLSTAPDKPSTPHDFTRPVSPAEVAEASSRLDEGSQLELLADARIEIVENQANFHVEHERMPFRPDFREALEVIAKEKRFRPSDLPLAIGPALACSRLLLNNGWLRLQ